MSQCPPSSHQTPEVQRARASDMALQVLNQNAKAGDDDQKVEKNDDLDQKGHSRNKDLRAEKDAVLQDKKTKDLAQRFMPHRKHEKADELHRQHHGQSGHDDCAGEIERDADAIGDSEGEDDGESANDQARTRLENHMDLAMDLHAADDPQNEIGQQQPAESRGEDR